MPISSFRGSLFASALTALGASVCCVGPLVLLSLGIGGAWISSLTALEPLRPWFVAATLILLMLAFRRLYRQPQPCALGAACADTIDRGRQRLIFWIVVVVVLALLSAPWLAPYVL